VNLVQGDEPPFLPEIRVLTPSGGLQRRLDGLPSPEAKQVAAVLARSPAVEIEPGVPHFRASFSNAALLVVEDGFVVLRDVP